MTRQFELSRRKVLASVGAIGAAGAGAGMGTSALFSDEEEFENNSITAGTTNLRVQAIVANDNIGGNGTITLSKGGTDQNVTPSGGAEQDGDTPTVNFTVSDIKPGDSFILGIDVIVEDNPMYVALDAHDLSDDENRPNPEPEALNSNPDFGGDALSGKGDLDNEMLLTHWGYLSSANNGIETNVTPSNITNNESYPSAPANISVTEFLTFLGPGFGTGPPGFVYAGAAGGSSPPGHGEWDNFANMTADPATAIGSGSNADTSNVTQYLRFELPASVGNNVQGDSFSFTLQWHAEQARNNTVTTASDIIQ